MTTEIQGVRPETSAARAAPSDGALREATARPDARTEAPAEQRRGSEDRSRGDGGAPEDLVSRFERALSGAPPARAAVDPALLALQAAAARLASLTGLAMPDGLKDAKDTTTSESIQRLVDVLAAAMAANGQFLPQISVTLTLPMPPVALSKVGAVERKPQTVVVQLRPEPDGSGIVLTLKPVGMGAGLAAHREDGRNGVAIGIGTVTGLLTGTANDDGSSAGSGSDDASLQAWLAGAFQRGSSASQRPEGWPGMAAGGPLATGSDLDLSIRLPMPTAPGQEMAQADLKPSLDRVMMTRHEGAKGAIETRVAFKDADDPGQVVQVTQITTQQLVPAAVAEAPPPVRGAEAVWDQIRVMAERMAAGVGAAGVHQIRLEIDPRLLPGVQVAIQMAAGQIQVEFFCANDASRRRLRAAAARDVDQMADRLGRTVHVTLHTNNIDDAQASAEHLHAGR